MHLAQTDDIAAPQLPLMLRRQEGPFRELDLLVIGAVLLTVLVILGLRKLFGKRR